MKITLARYVCENCASSFEAPMLGESSYGEFLLWSRNGKVAYLASVTHERWNRLTSAEKAGAMSRAIGVMNV